MSYEFMVGDEVSVGDVKQIAALTLDGAFCWYMSDRRAAYSAEPTSRRALDDEHASDEVVGENLKGIRIGFNPSTRRWHYLRLTNGFDEVRYVEAGVTPEMQQAVDVLFDLAVASDGGLIATGALDIAKIRQALAI